MIDARLQLKVHDGPRRFALDMAFACDAPVLALYGPSGAGKSLALQAMAGLLPTHAGHCRIGGHTLHDHASAVALPPQARRVGYLFQHYALFPHLSVKDNIAFGLRPWHGRLAAADAARVQALMASFGLAGLAEAKPAALSGGQQQRVALARALACEPQVLLLDEPFAALNPMLRQKLRDELSALRQQWGVPMVVVTHDVEDVLALADVVCLVDEGRVLKQLDLRAASAAPGTEQRQVLRSQISGQPERPPREGEARLRALLEQPLPR